MSLCRNMYIYILRYFLMLNKPTLHFVLLLLYFSTAFSQNSQIDFDYLKNEDGLPHNNINDITQDSSGYIWVATDNGLGYYDNYKFRIFQSENKKNKRIANNHVYKIHVDLSGNLWIGTKHSLELYNRKSDSFEHFFVANLPTHERVPIVEIIQENDSILLLGTDGGGLRKFNTKSFKNNLFLFDKEKREITKRISSIYKDKFNRYWIGTIGNGIILYDVDLQPKGYAKEYFSEFLANTEIRDIIQLNSNELLIATYGRGIFQVNIEDLSIKPFIYYSKKTRSVLRVFKLLKQDQFLYIGTDGNGIICYDLEKKEYYTYINSGIHTESISNNVVKTIFIDKEKNMWIGHYQGGISLSRNKNNFRNLSSSPYNRRTLNHPNVTSILIDSQNMLWIGTDGGGLNIVRDEIVYNSFNNNLVELLGKNCPLNILSLYEDSNGQIWVGTYLDGIFIYNPKRKKLLPFNSLYPELQISNKDIRCITQSRDGKMWIGTNGGGVYIIDPDVKKMSVLQRNEHKTDQTLSLNWIRFIHEDNYGYIWIGTTYGLNVYDPIKQTFRQYFHNDSNSFSLPDDVQYTIAEDANNQIWIGTSAGLSKYNRKTDNFNNYTINNGLPSNIIYSILSIDKNYLWISTNNGLSKYDIEHNLFTNYNVSDGLISNSFQNGAGFKKNDSILFFGSASGLTSLNVNKIIDIDYKIPVIINELRLFDQLVEVNQEINNRIILKENISTTNTIELLKKENVLTLEFTALSYSYSDKIEYSYRLKGFSNTWNKLSNKHSVSYTNLKSGIYYFQVKVSNMGANQPQKTLKIVVLPPFYETFWFKLIVVFIIIFAAYIFLRNRIQNMKRQQDIIRQKYKIEKLAAEKEKAILTSKIQEKEMKIRQDEVNFRSSQLVLITMLLTHKNETMNKVKNEISSFLKEIGNEKKKPKLEKLIDTINSDFKVEEDWKRFEEHFNNVHEDFFVRLKEKHPDLSITYLRLCAFLKLNLSTKEIASLMNISSRGVEKARSRLRKKMSLEPGVNLISHISTL